MNAHSRSELESKQLWKFRALVAYANQYSPHYADIITTREISLTSCVPTDFPILTKDDLLRYFDRIVTVRGLTKDRLEDFVRQSKDPFELFDKRYVVITTSGTSGSRGICLYSLAEFVGRDRSRPEPPPTRTSIGMECARRIPMEVKSLSRKIKVAFVGVAHGHFAGITMVGSLRQGDNRERFDLLPLDINEPWKQIVRRLNEFQPDGVLAYSTAMRELAERQLNGELTICPTFLQCGAELLSQNDKRFIERSFQTPVLNVYGSSECLYMGYGRGSDKMELFEDNLIFEIQPEYTAVTNLFNCTMPLIRYRFDDILTKIDDGQNNEEGAGNPYTKIEALLARSEFNLRLENDFGEDESVSACSLMTVQIPGIKRFQCIVTGKRRFTVKVCYQDEVKEVEKRGVLARLSRELAYILDSKRMSGVEFDVREDEALKVDRNSGKFRLVQYA